MDDVHSEVVVAKKAKMWLVFFFVKVLDSLIQFLYVNKGCN